MAQVELVEVPHQMVLAKRDIGPYSNIPTMIMQLYQYAMGHNLPLVGSPMFICHEESAEAAEQAAASGQADLELVLPLAQAVEVVEGFACYELPGGRMAKIVHQGPYDEVGPYYEQLFTWMAEQGLHPAGCSREVYLNDPQQVPPEEILTEIYMPVA
jgi:effector-binding domain-containing protein